ALTLRRRTDVRAYAPSLTRDWLLRAHARCGLCGTIIACILRARDKSGGYYVCRHRTHPQGGPRCSAAPYVRRDDTERRAPGAMLARVKELAVLLTKAPPRVRAKPTKDYEGEAERIKAARTRLLTLVTDPDCGVSLDHVKEQLRELNVKIATLAEHTRQHRSESVEDSAEGRARALAFVHAILTQWDTFGPGELRALLMALAAKVLLTSKGTIEYVWREPSAFVPASGKASEEIKRLAAPPSDAARPMLAAANEDRPTEIGASRVA